MSDRQQAKAKGGVMRATIHDVAARAEVSIKTVSRVLNKEPTVRNSTRDRVLKAADALDYEPHPQARGLKGRLTHSIGLLYENPQEFSYVQKALEGVFDACRSRNLSLLLRPCPERVVVGDVRRFVLQTRVDGVVLLAPLSDHPDIVAMLKELGIPMAQVSPGVAAADTISVNPRDREASEQLTEHVISIGHRRIGFIEGDPRHGSSHKRLNGFLASMRKHGLDSGGHLISQGFFTFDSGKQAASQLLRRHPSPTAIIASNDDMAAGAIVAAREMGLDVPGDVSVVGFDDSPIASHTWPALTTLRQPISEMASTAALRLIDQVAGVAQVAGHQEFDCEIVMRDSLAAPGPAE